MTDNTCSMKAYTYVHKYTPLHTNLCEIGKTCNQYMKKYARQAN